MDSVADKARSRQVTFACIGQQGDDFFAGVFWPLCQQCCGIGSGTGRDPYQQTFVFCQFAAGRKSVFGVDGEHFVHDAAVKVLRDEIGADTLDLMRTGLTTGQDR